MIDDYSKNGNKSGIEYNGSCKATVLEEKNWQNNLVSIENQIIFIDEESEFVKTKEFAEAINHSSNYFVIINREDLQQLSISVEEIYELKASGKRHTLKKYYQNTNLLYGKNKKLKKRDLILLLFVEDSTAGFEFYKRLLTPIGIQCLSTYGRTKIVNTVNDIISNINTNVLIIADGAVFGSEIEKLIALQETRNNMLICLPESFEWLILKSGLIKDIMSLDKESVSQSIDSTLYISWEDFFTKYLIEKTQGTQFEYSKKKINENYLIQENGDKILLTIESLFKNM